MNTALNAARRARELDALAAGEVVDLLVIGGGVTGAGIALDAASRGLSVALVERRDLANGTSRWSSKLVHGGLRYLAHGEVGLALESARERGVLMERTAPHLTRALPFVIPFTADVSRSQALQVRAGARAGEALRVAAGTSVRTLPRPRHLSVVETLQMVPGLRYDGLRGGFLTWDGQLEDDARLVVALARTAAGFGARILTYVDALAADGTGARVRDARTGATLEIRARHVVSATGVWADALDDTVKLRPSKGVHVVLSSALLGHPRAALTLPVPGEPNRFVFALPQPDGVVYLGLTDDPADGTPPDEPTAESSEIDFLLRTASTALELPLTAADVLGSFAGYRPLVAGAEGATADLSRRHALVESADGLLTVVGGKLTTYRRMAQDTVDRVAARPGVDAAPCRTTRLPLVGAAQRPKLAKVDAPSRLVRRFGTEAPDVAALAADEPSLLGPIADGVLVTGVEVLHAVAAEGALDAEDVLARRTRLSLTPRLAAAARPVVEALVDRALTRAAAVDRAATQLR